MKILILGINGFIGSNLTKSILKNTDWDVSGLDIQQETVEKLLENKKLTFKSGCINKEKKWVLEQINMADVVIPLTAIATPMSYIKDPISVFQSVFEANMWVVKECARLGRRIIFPSTSEVYGMCDDASFHEQNSSLVLGPIHKERWIYSCSKQLLDRVIWAYGKDGLPFTLFRPFNWIGYGQDNNNKGTSRLIPQFLGNILRNEPLQLVDGGKQRRSFTDISDGIDALIRIIRNENGEANGKIFNIGNPNNNASIIDVSNMLMAALNVYPEYKYLANNIQIKSVTKEEFYGSGYQDVQQRIPDICNIQEALKWAPSVSLEQSIENIVRHTFYNIGNKEIQRTSLKVG
ncbi:MAG: bifunctional UDP-4-keto-pentose/UDP-xylose synthase [Thiohalomonas sp.]|nr:bifunctional UDP-4-keto-pentose/UDP-xylose synthase [Thiohalomonas sp.]